LASNVFVFKYDNLQFSPSSFPERLRRWRKKLFGRHSRPWTFVTDTM